LFFVHLLQIYQITQLEILPAPFGGRFYTYVKLHTDEGIIGIGEAACSGKEQALHGALRDAEGYLIEADPFQIEKLWSLIYRNAFNVTPCEGFYNIVMKGPK
jgi:galactonate dehydratase